MPAQMYRTYLDSTQGLIHVVSRVEHRLTSVVDIIHVDHESEEAVVEKARFLDEIVICHLSGGLRTSGELRRMASTD